MRIVTLKCDEEAEEHIWTRHHVAVVEIEQAAHNHALIVRGRGRGLYEVYGRTDAGRLLMIAVRCLSQGAAKVITAREMSGAERRRFRKRTAH